MMQGVEECSICYCILHTNNELPRRTCRICKKKFHDACLVRSEKETITMKIRISVLSFLSFVGFDRQINRRVHIVERTFKNFRIIVLVFRLFLTSIIFFFVDITVLYEIQLLDKKDEINILQL